MLENEEIFLLKAIGSNIRQLRKKLNLSQEILSFDADIPRNQIGRIERGQINTSVITLLKISKALKVNLHDLILIDTLVEEQRVKMN